MEVTFRATFFGLHGQQNYPSGALAWKGHIGSETLVQGKLKVRVRTWTLKSP